jgi:translin
MVNFDAIRSELETYDSLRDEIITIGRNVIKRSKLLIYALHRNELDKGKKLLSELEKTRKEMLDTSRKNHKLTNEGSFRAATQEYVEAVLYYAFVTTGKIELLNEIEPDQFVLGMCDVPGELNRRAVYLAGKGKIQEVIAIRDIVETIYGELLTFNARNNEMRRKIDSVKYELRKLEDLVLSMKLKS